MSGIISTLGRKGNCGKLARWLRYRSIYRSPSPCPACGVEHCLHAVYWRVPQQLNGRLVVVPQRDYCERCAVEQLGVQPRLDGHAPVEVIDGGDL